ncbi:LacI family DNA-binding transcriptional regulator [Amycolatopsis cynarae]|uniref:LacI family DNA-binding transcriptional regulator n=1 Tax=Amycolatopsis cynarae TaxID=2995223 RepID=A0ABY7AYA1_9PSEU|nr:LacI family DNA-binding transcriptional regulator [Amycolatopsis sp. HUAS 11-8]WAL63631.1 LacI family DNA-binding transcriptional regulator [Amycolatopsis sp. HUAS 11-8]
MISDVTLSDVARAAGVSLATASRVLNGSTRTVGAALRQRVLDTAEKLNYAPNAAAQAMVRGHLNVVGVVVHDITDPYFSAVASGVMLAAEEAGLVVALSSTRHRPEREAEYVAAFRRQRARAVVLIGSRTTDRSSLEELRAEIERFEAGGGRVAAVSQRRLNVDTVVIENRAGAQALAEALVGLRYRRFAVLAGPSTVVTAKDRLAGIRAGLARHRVPLAEDNVVHGDFTRDGGYRAMEELLSRKNDVQCVVAVNDVMAVGAMAALRDRGFPLPERMAVAGFDDIATLRDVTPRLTTVRIDLQGVGETAMRLLLDEPAGAPRVRRTRGEVILRESTPRR